MATQRKLFTEPLRKKRVAGGIATSNVIMTATAGNNEEMFPTILGLHVSEGAEIADVTYGKGVFWKSVDLSRYKLHATDIKTGIDCRSLPYKNGSMDCVILDPPYMEGLYRRHEGHLAGDGTYAAFRDHYSNGEKTVVGPKCFVSTDMAQNGGQVKQRPPG